MIKKICYLDEDGRFGGPQQRMILVAKEINKDKKFKINFLIPNKDTNFFKKKLNKYKLPYDEKDITRLSLEITTLIKYLFFFFYEIKIIISYLKNNHIDILQVNSTSQFKGIIASLFLKIKCIWVIEDTNLGYCTKKIFLYLSKISNCKIIYTSKVVKDYYLKNSKINNFKKEIFAPVDSKIFNPRKKYKKLKFKKKEILITTISGIVPIKGIENFLTMAKEILKLYSNVQFLLVGNIVSSQKKYSKKILKLISEFNIRDFKYIRMSDEVPRILYNSDIFICTSLSEAGPLTIYEAIKMKVPIITTNVGAVPQLLKNNISGYICSPGDVNSLIDNTKKMLNKYPNIKLLTKNADYKSYIFDLSYVTNLYRDIYKN